MRLPIAREHVCRYAARDLQRWRTEVETRCPLRTDASLIEALREHADTGGIEKENSNVGASSVEKDVEISRPGGLLTNVPHNAQQRVHLLSHVARLNEEPNPDVWPEA